MNIANKLIKILRTSFELGDGFFYKIKLILISILIPIKNRLGIKKFIAFNLKLKKFNKSFNVYIADGSDLAILEEIFIKDEYKKDFKFNPHIIFDLGSNIGLSVIYFKLKYPDAKIYAFEPDPNIFERLKKNTQQFNDVFCFNLAVSGKSGKEKFYIYPNSSMSSSLLKRLDNESFIEITTKSLDDVMDEENVQKIDLIKFDIEGSEYEVFKAFRNIKEVRSLLGELHFDLMKINKNDFFDIFFDYKKELKNLKNGSRAYVFFER